MIISQTPVRFSFLGGGTDYPEYYNRKKGAVVGTTIDKYSYITLSRLSNYFDHNFHITYSSTEQTKTISDIEHPSVRECLRFMNISSNLEIHYFADLPARTGLGSSSAFTVGLLNALHAFKGEYTGREALAKEAIHVEQELISEDVGSQDQYHAAYGGLNLIEFDDKSVQVSPIIVEEEFLNTLEENLMMFYTGITRYSQNILTEQMKQTKAKQNDDHLERMYDLVYEGIDTFTGKASIKKFGELMHKGWEIKKKLSDKITNEKISSAYQAAREAGAWGGKLAGAGGGGFLFLVVPKEKQDKVRNSLRPLEEVRFGFEQDGSRIIYYRTDK